jgi:hypothetical protein
MRGKWLRFKTTREIYENTSKYFDFKKDISLSYTRIISKQYCSNIESCLTTVPFPSKAIK